MNLNLNVNQNFNDSLDHSRHDVWRYARLLGNLKKENLVDSLQSNFTPIEKVGDWLVKREDKSMSGSHKFRALAFQISRLLDKKIERAVLSSSGNAAIAASRLLPKNKNLKLFTFLSKKTPPEKLAALEFSKNFVPILSDRPLRMAKYAVKHFKLNDLRPSQDPNAIIGFRSLGFEIFEQNPKFKNIFSFATSFASTRGIIEAYEILVKLGEVKKMPRIFAITSSGQLAGSLSLPTGRQVDKRVDKNFVESTRSGQRFLSSRQQSTRVDSRQSKFSSIEQVDISDEEILSSRQKFSKIETSNEGFASLAAAEKVNPRGESLVVLTGKIWEKNREVDFSKFEKADNFAEIDKILARNE